MRIELKDIKGGMLEQGYSCSLADFPELSSISADGGPKFGEPLTFRLRLQQSGRLVEVDGHLDAQIVLQCGRCLRTFEQQLTESFTLTFAPCGHANKPEEEVELEAVELGLIVYEDDVLELQAPLQEQLLMAIPINPLCSEKCRGLCPECGVDLNTAKCNCVKKIFNNKFNVLADINLKSSE